MFHLTQEELFFKRNVLNRAVYVSNDVPLSLPLLSAAACTLWCEHKSSSMSTTSSSLPRSAEITTIENILSDSSLSIITNHLLETTGWFDVANGQSFASHHDDGISQVIFGHLAVALTDQFNAITAHHVNNVDINKRHLRSPQYEIKKYFALALPVTFSDPRSVSPLISGDCVVIVEYILFP